MKDETDITLPKGFELNYFDEYMQITRVWLSPKKIIGALMGAFVFNSVWISNGFVDILFSDRELLLKLFCLLFIVIGFVSIYLIIITWLNKTQIYVSKNAIEIKHQPLPWFGNKRLETNNIKQLFVKKKVSNRGNNRRIVSFNVEGLTSEDKTFKLITRLEHHQHAHFIERKVEEYLGIENEEVNDETR